MNQQKIVILNTLCSLLQVIGLLMILAGKSRFLPPSASWSMFETNAYWAVVGIAGLASVVKMFTMNKSSMPLAVFAGVAGAIMIVISIAQLKRT